MTRIKSNRQEDLRKRICQFRKIHSDKDKSFTDKHFMAEGFAKSTIYDIIQRADNNVGPLRKNGSGRIRKKQTIPHRTVD